MQAISVSGQVVWAFDRIAPSVKHFLEVLDELTHLNIEFISFRENIDTGSPPASPQVQEAAEKRRP
jgi:DNA invertase Pin-like site-specific DNA recombinase